jgi:hypothetical protein
MNASSCALCRVQAQQADNELALRDLQETHELSLDDAADRLKVRELTAVSSVCAHAACSV